MANVPLTGVVTLPFWAADKKFQVSPRHHSWGSVHLPRFSLSAPVNGVQDALRLSEASSETTIYNL